MRTGLGIVDSNLGDALHGWLSVNSAVSVEKTAVPVVGVFAKADVASDV